MPLIDHLGMTVDDLPAAIAQWDPVLTELGYTRTDADASVAWDRDGETELILFPAREQGTGPHRHGSVGWQHLAFDIASRAEVDRLHAIAIDVGWAAVREPKLYPRFNERYYASFVEDASGIRIEFAHNPPHTPPPGESSETSVFGDPAAVVPAGLQTDEFVLRPITADDAERDFDAIMETREHLRLWEQSTWPADDFTLEANREDLVGLEERHAAHRAFTYTVLDPDGAECLGCVYIFPVTASFLARSEVTAVGTDAWESVQAFVSFWVRASRMKTGLDARLLAALRTWFRKEWGFERVVFDTSETFTQQVELLEGTDLTLTFRLREPGKDADHLSYG